MIPYPFTPVELIDRVFYHPSFLQEYRINWVDTGGIELQTKQGRKWKTYLVYGLKDFKVLVCPLIWEEDGFLFIDFG